MTISAGLGSDVPFFLRGGCALGQGRGENLRPLPAPDMWYVVVFPNIELPFGHKTAAMFRALSRATSASATRFSRRRIRLDAGLSLDPKLLGNAFERPLYALVPELRQVRDCLSGSGAEHFGDNRCRSYPLRACRDRT